MFRRLALLFKDEGPRRPEIDAMLDAELMLHGQAMDRLLDYVIEKNPQAAQEIGLKRDYTQKP